MLLVGKTYSRSEVFEILAGQSVQIGGNRSLGVVSEGRFVLGFANLGVPGKTGHDFPNFYDEETHHMDWFGQPNSHSKQPMMAALIERSRPLLMFTRYKTSDPFKFRGQAQILGWEDRDDVVVSGSPIKAIAFKLGFDQSADFATADKLADESTGRAPGAKGQGRSSDAEANRAIELRAMELATKHYESLGYSVEDTSANNPFDLLLSKNSREIIVEVKGTQSAGEVVNMTAGEVNELRLRYPHTRIVVVSGISLDRSIEPVAASGGELVEYKSPDLLDSQLTPTQYRVKLPD